MAPMKVAFTVDLEPDCPPYLWTFRGVEQGMPALLDLLANAGVPATFFSTGDVALRYPRIVERLVAAGHELACHGMSHTAFTELGAGAARAEIVESAAILREFAPVTSFRAPYLKFPEAYVPMLEDAGFGLDSSHAIYKLAYWKSRLAASGRRSLGASTHLTRIPASVTSSVLRVARPVRTTYLRALSDPVVLFVHPWEFVDLTGERLRLDCRFKTGKPALDCAADVLRWYSRRGADFVTMRQLARQLAH
jgi:peptidoglycan/xylan/chitin deacetylase (PgdA/CDA1 family)